MDGARTLPFLRILQRHNTSIELPGRVRFGIDNVPHWVNLKRWLQAQHKDPMVLYPVDASKKLVSGDDKMLVIKTHRLVKLMEDQPWEIVEAALELLHNVASVHNVRWKWARCVLTDCVAVSSDVGQMGEQEAMRLS